METVPGALDPAARVLLQALLNGLWQGAVLAAVAALGLRLLPRSNAATRHGVWWSALLLVAALPLLPSARASLAERAVPAPDDAVPAAYAWSLPAPPEPWSLLVVLALAGVAALRLALLLRGVRELRGLKRAAVPLPEEHARSVETCLGQAPPRGAEIRLTAGIANPITVGFRRPMVLLPSRLLEELEEVELRQVVVHELAHLRRWDDWSNLVQRTLEAVFFFHPVVRWIGRRLELEREIACDDQVVAALSGTRSYALCLTRLAAMAVATRRVALAPSVVPGRSQLAHRIRALLDPRRPRGLRVSAAALAGAAALLAGGALGLREGAPALALAARQVPLTVLDAARAELLPVTAEADRMADLAARPAAAEPRGSRALLGSSASDQPPERVPQPRVVLACGAPGCSGSAASLAPAIVERAEVPVVPVPAVRVASGPALPRDGSAERPGVELTLGLRVGLPGGGMGRAVDEWRGYRAGGWGRAAGGIRLRLPWTGERWRPNGHLPR